jgi:3-methyladenine DNA glycosylase AlkD
MRTSHPAARSTGRGPAAKPRTSAEARARRVVADLRRRGTRRDLLGMARFGIVAAKAFGVSVATLRLVAKPLGRDHDLALALWDTGWYEARLLAALVAEPARVTPALMDRWCRGFENWADCDTVCFHLFDRTPHAFEKVARWATRRREFEKRAAFALLASLALHDRASGDDPFLRCLPLVERAADDGRNFVKKAVSWALRAIGARSARLHEAALAAARRLSDSPVASARWVGSDVRRDLTRPLVKRRIAARST